jgi:hypothetical protein
VILLDAAPTDIHPKRVMANPQSQPADRVGPFTAGATSSELIGLTQRKELGLGVLGAPEQKSDQFRQRCDDLNAAAQEFFYDYEGSASLVLLKSDDSEHIPDFIQYAYCRLLEDRLAGLMLFGSSSDAGSHDQIDQQENAFWEQSAEIADALSAKYPQNPEALVNYLNFAVYPALPRFPDIDPTRVFSGFSKLIDARDTDESISRIETHYWGPTVVLASQHKLGAEVMTAAAHTSQSARRIYASERWFVVCHHVAERYVRTIESLHVFTTLLYVSRPIMEDVGKKLNERRGAQVEAAARRVIEAHEDSLRQAQAARQARISRLSEIL